MAVPAFHSSKIFKETNSFDSLSDTRVETPSEVCHAQFIKKTCSSFSRWRPWQKRILLCGLTNRCSSYHLELFSSALEPVFHRDFATALTGRYPSSLLVQSRLSLSPKKKIALDRLTHRDFFKPMPRKAGHLRSRTCYSQNSLVRNGEMEDLSKRRASVHETTFESKMSSTSAMTLVSSWKASPAVAEEREEQEERQSSSGRVSLGRIPVPPLPLRGRLCHDHLQSYAASRSSVVPDAESDDYFSDDGWRAKKGFTKTGIDKLAMSSYFPDPCRRRLAEHFKEQLQEIWKWIEICSELQRFEVLQAIVKCCDEKNVSFLVQCLIQRLHDWTNINSLPDEVFLTIFSHLDGPTVYQCGRVCHRWRFLSLLSRQWKVRLQNLGTSKGVASLTKALEAAGKGRQVDWRKAYEEMSVFFRQNNDQSKAKQRSSALAEESEGQVETADPFDDFHASRLDLRTLLLIAKIKGLSKRSPCDADIERPPSPPLSETKEIVKEETDENGAIIRRPLVKPLARMFRRLLENKEQGSIDFIVNMKTKHLQGKTEHSQKGRQQREMSPKIVSVALDVRPDNLQALAQSEAQRLLGLAGVFIAEGDELAADEEDIIDIRNVRQLRGHGGAVFCTQLDIRRIMTGSLDRTLRVWDIRSGRAVGVLSGHKGGVRCVQFDDEKIITGSWDTTCKVWDVVKFTELRTLSGHRGCVSCMKMVGKRLVTGSHDRTLRVWNTDNWLCEQVIVAHESYINCLEFDGRCIISGSADKTLKVWDLATGDCLRVLSGHRSAVLSCRVQMQLLVSGSFDGFARLWDVATGECVLDIQVHEGPVHAVAIFDCHFFTTGSDFRVKEWSLTSGCCIRSLQGHTGPVRALEVFNCRLVTCSDDWTVRVWENNAPVFMVGALHDVEQTENISIRRLVGDV